MEEGLCWPIAFLQIFSIQRTKSQIGTFFRLPTSVFWPFKNYFNSIRGRTIFICCF